MGNATSRSGNDVVFQLEHSQFNFEGGESACAAVCGTVAVHLLEQTRLGRIDVDSSEDGLELLKISFESFVEEGVDLARRIHEYGSASGAASHENVMDLLQAPPAQQLRSRIQIGIPENMFTRGGAAEFRRMILKNLKNPGSQKPRALFVTKPPETIVIFWVPCLAPKPFLLFDSHSSGGRGATLRCFATETPLAEELSRRFKYTPLPRDVDPNEQLIYNMCELTPVALPGDEMMMGMAPAAAMDGNSEAGRGQRRKQDPEARGAGAGAGAGCPRPDAVPLPHLLGQFVVPGSPCAATDAAPKGTGAYPSLPEPSAPPASGPAFLRPPPAAPGPGLAGTPLSEAEERMYCCAISQELMADPVLAADGNTYERGMIERHWQTQRENEEARRRAAEGTGERPEPAGDACCGRPRSQILPTSPLTNEPIANDTLLLNRVILSLIDLAVNTGRVPPEDAESWRERRRAAVAADRERESAAAAVANGGAAEQAEAPAAEPPATPALHVRNANNIEIRGLPAEFRQGRRWFSGPCVAPTRLAVDLCEAADRMLPYEANDRCAIPSCQAPLGLGSLCLPLFARKPRNCRRCGRIVCHRCSLHSVLDYANQSAKAVICCGECVEDFIDRLPATPAGQRSRQLLTQRGISWTQQLESEAAARALMEHRGHAARTRANDPDAQLPAVPPAVPAAGGLRGQAPAAVVPPAGLHGGAPRRGGGGSGREEGEIQRLQQHYDQLLAQDASSMSPDQQFQHMMRLSQAMEDLETAQIAAAEQRTHAAGPTPDQGLHAGSPHRSDGGRGREEGEIQRLQQQYDQLLAQDAASMDPDQQFQHMMRLSQAMEELETAQIAAAEQRQQMGGFSPIRVRERQPEHPEQQQREHLAYTTGLADATRHADVLQALNAEYTQLEAMDTDGMSPEELERRFIRISSVMAELEAAQMAFAQVGVVPQGEGAAAAEAGEAAAAAGANAAAAAAAEDRGGVGEDQPRLAPEEGRGWPLPLELQYPTNRMRRREHRVQEAWQRAWDQAEIAFQRERAAERRRRREQEARDEQAQLEARQRELDRVANMERQAELERQRMAAEERRRQSEQEAQEEERLFQQAVAGWNVTGGYARMCGGCGRGPLINHECPDMAANQAHNVCTVCGWFDANWNNWPRWDGGVRANNYNRSRP